MLFQWIKGVGVFSFSFFYRHFLPYGRADLTADASLRAIRGGLTTAS